MIRKNNADSVAEATSSAAKVFKSGSGTGKPDLEASAAQKALDAVSVLTGVGPATASLILAAYQPNDIPFFEDEMFQWLCSDTWKQKGKLAYDKKEYAELFIKVWELRERLGRSNVQMVDIEKASFVMMHNIQALDDTKEPAEKVLPTKAGREQAVNSNNTRKRSTAKPEASAAREEERKSRSKRAKR
jgi:hypothetical protein